MTPDPPLDTLGIVLFLLLLATVIATGAALLGYRPEPAAVLGGLTAGVIASSCFLRGYRAAREG